MFDVQTKSDIISIINLFIGLMLSDSKDHTIVLEAQDLFIHELFPTIPNHQKFDNKDTIS